MTTQNMTERPDGLIDAQRKWIKAVQTKDIAALRTLYSHDLNAYDVSMPFICKKDAYMKHWREWFEMTEGAITYEITEIERVVSGDVACAHSLDHIVSMTKKGETTDMWLRRSLQRQRLNGVWLITHEHVSAPIDMSSGQAVLTRAA
jgi:ketosteroid isomerase-like protein